MSMSVTAAVKTRIFRYSFPYDKKNNVIILPVLAGSSIVKASLRDISTIKKWILG